MTGTESLWVDWQWWLAAFTVLATLVAFACFVYTLGRSRGWRDGYGACQKDWGWVREVERRVHE